jgi:hypothetical protein
MTEISPDYSALRDALADLLRAERLAPQRRGDWLLIDDAFPALRAHVGQDALRVELALYDGRVIRETFAPQAGLAAFSDGPLRVFLSAFWERHNPGLVAREVWKRTDGPWLAITGPYLRESSAGEAAPVPYPLFGRVQDFVREAVLDDDLHWLSMQVSVVEGQAHVAAQLDNIEQPELADAVRALDWPRDARTHVLRNFMLLARS